MGNKSKKKAKVKAIFKNDDEMLEGFKKIVRGLPFATKMAIQEFIECEVNRMQKDIEKRCKGQYQLVLEALDRNFTAAVIEKTDLSMAEIDEIFRRSFDLIEEDNKKVLEIKKENKGEDWTMVVNKFEGEIREKALELIEKGVKQKEAIDTLVMQFPKLSRSMVTNGYKRTKEEYKRKKEEKAIEDAAKYILEEPVKVNKEVKPETVEIEQKSIEEVKKLINDIPDSEGCPDLKIISKKIVLDVSGKHAMYYLENDRVTTTSGVIDFNNITKEEATIEILKKMDELKGFLNEINCLFELAK